MSEWNGFSTRLGRVGLALLLGASVIGGVAHAQQSWPNRPVRILVPYPAGGSTDILSRLLGQRLVESLGQPVVIENRGGGNGGVAAGFFAKTSQDDHFFLVVSLPMMSINLYLYSKLGYDPDADFIPIGLIAHTPNVMVVAPALPVDTLKGFAAHAKASPKGLTYSSSGSGSAGHLLNELFKASVGIQFLHVPYKGNAPALQALIAGDVDFTTDNLPQLLPQIRAGKLKPLAVTSPQRWFQLPEVPTVTESGFPSMTTTAWFGLVAQAKTPPEVIARMNSALVATLRKPDFAARLQEFSFEALPGSPDDMRVAVRKEREKWRQVVQISGARVD